MLSSRLLVRIKARLAELGIVESPEAVCWSATATLQELAQLSLGELCDELAIACESDSEDVPR